jgi:pilus assembly protein FimV
MLESFGNHSERHPPQRMRAVSTFIATGTALWIAAMPAHAIGFGRVSNATQLGQPLDFVAVVRLDADEQLGPECVSAEVQSGENRLAPGQIRVSLEGPVDSNTRSVRVSTAALIDEPVVTVSVTLGCTAKITRRFVAFVDPPLINVAQTAAVEAAPMRAETPAASPPSAPTAAAPVPRAEIAPSRPLPERTTSTRQSTRPAATRTRSIASAREPATPRAAKPRRTPPRQSAVARAATGGPRLQLETAAPVVARAASAAAPPPAAPTAVAAVESASAARPDPVADQLAAERQRIQVLEEGLATLSKRSQATQASLATIQARLKDAESERYANPLVYVLAAIVGLLALAVVWLGWRQSRARRSGQWWAGPAAEPGPSQLPLAVAAEPEAPAASSASAMPLADDAFAVSSVIDGGGPTVPVPEPARELSVEELIDLEQQVEFFVVLGQDEAAIELLMSHVRSDGGNSPLPYLKLLEIYRRRGEREAYQRVRERFNRSFNAYAPDWESDPQQGRSLTDYPDTIARLQRLWSSPTRTMGTLEASLFRRNRTDETFDLPAYRELLLLYSVARDLAEHPDAPPVGAVDLLLPFDGAAEEPISRLSATPPSAELPNGGLGTTRLDFEPAGDHAAQAGRTAPMARDDHPPADPAHLIDFNLDLPSEPPKPGSYH